MFTMVRKRKGISVVLTAMIIVATVAVVGIGIAYSYGLFSAWSQGNSATGGTSPQTNQTITLVGAGSTLVFPLMSVWTFTYHQLHPNIQVNYQSIGSGGGIAQITAGTVDFGASDAPLTPSQYTAINRTILTIPESASAVVPAYNIPGVGNGLRFTGYVLARIFLGNITMWNDPAIQSLNPNIALPAHSITVVHRSDGSGTMYAFTNFLADSSQEWAKKVGYGTSVSWPTGIGCKGNEGVAGCIINTPYSIGPLELAYVIVNKGLVSYGAVQNAAGNFILANITNVQAALAAGATNLPAGNARWSNVSIIDNLIKDTSATNAYPITTLTYILVYQEQTDKTRGTALVNFLWWIINSGQQAGTSIGYVPLPQSIVQIDDQTINSITYNGVPLHTGP